MFIIPFSHFFDRIDARPTSARKPLRLSEMFFLMQDCTRLKTFAAAKVLLFLQICKKKAKNRPI